MNAFITGTDTGVGKTYVTSRLIRRLRAQGLDTVGFKPICCGSREDAEILRAAADGALGINEVNPVWLRTPGRAVHVAAMIEKPVRSTWHWCAKTFAASPRPAPLGVWWRGSGDGSSPSNRDFTVADSCRRVCALPIVVVVKNRLGRTQSRRVDGLSPAIRARGLTCAGLILNDGQPIAER